MAPREPSTARSLAKSLGVSEILAQILINRKLDDREVCRRFLHPTLSDLARPQVVHHMDRAAQRIGEAFRRKERVLVYGDYDVDGVTGTTLMIEFLRLGGLDPVHYIPDRLTEGYGFSDRFVDNLDSCEADLIISIDNGIASHGPIEAIRRREMDVIVTDHHEPASELPDAHALVNPKLSESVNGSHDLCGAAVAYKTAWAVAEKLSPGRKVSPEFREFLVESLALVALGTICDAVPLQNENRILASYGLRAIHHCRRPGLRALREVACPDTDRIDEEDVGFRLGPRINAAGRMGHADLALELLLSSDFDHALSIAKELDSVNRQRKNTEQKILAEAVHQLQKQDGGEEQPVFVLAGQGWHSGVMGIVASRIAERFNRPAVLIGLDGATGRGSARSIRGIHLLDLITRCSDHLIRFGGHAFAAGLEIQDAQVEPFRRSLSRVVGEQLVENGGIDSSVDVDLEVSLEELSLGLVDEIRRLAPYGRENPAPLFLATGVEVMGEPRLVGNDSRHLALVLRQGKKVLRAIAFDFGAFYEPIRQRRKISMLFVPIRNTFRGHTSLEIQILDLRVD